MANKIKSDLSLGTLHEEHSIGDIYFHKSGEFVAFQTILKPGWALTVISKLLR